MSCPPELLAQIKNHRAMLAQGTHHQEWIGRWWDALLLNDRRTLLALADLDDSTDNARRAWMQHSEINRAKLLNESKRLQKLLEAIRWA
jgi:hypothetical protein